MGCGSSSENVATTPTSVVSPPTTANTTMLHPTTLSATAVSSVTTGQILIACHTSQQALSERLKQGLLKQSLRCYSLNESTPKSLNVRANCIEWCDVFVVIISRLYQRTPFCMEALNYAKDKRKPVIVLMAEPTFRPYGALGAISASALRSIVLNDDTSMMHAVSEITNNTRTQIIQDPGTGNSADSLELTDAVDGPALPSGSSTCRILICTADDGAAVAQLIFDSLTSTQPSIAIENVSKPNATSSITQCTVLVAIVTPQLEQSTLSRTFFEQARRLGKPSVPVLAVKKWRPDGWLGLSIAGRIFFRIFDHETAYKPFYDSNPMTNLRVEIEVACRPIPTENEREEIEKASLRKELDAIKSKLTTWPPARKSRIVNLSKSRQPVRVQLPQPHASAFFEHTHHSITRVDMKAPPALLDQYGLPKRRPLDCMISYQWDKQELVRQIYEDMHMRQVQIWFDIWGSMQGSTNDAMATGVECAKVIVLFLSKAYIESVNCQLEFRYAVQRGKAFVVLRMEPGIIMAQEMLEAIEGFPQYDVYSYDTLEQKINGVPLIDVMVQAIRLLAQAQPPDPVDDCSTELFELRALVDDARDALSAQTGEARYKICTRCGQQFDDHSKDGCKRHVEYFLGGGGGLLEDQWTCCRQQTADSPGCRPCEHTDQPRVFFTDPHYGTSSWKPA